MHPTSAPTLTGPPPSLLAFVATMRTVLRTGPGSTAPGPDAVETWSPTGYEVVWSTPAGVWRVTVGDTPDPRPLLRGPGGFWRVEAEAGVPAAELTLTLLRAAGAIPRTRRLGDNLAPNTMRAAPGPAQVRGQWFRPAPAPEPPRVVPYPAGQRAPEVPPGYIALPVAPGPHGLTQIRLPDGRVMPFDEARAASWTYITPGGKVALLAYVPWKHVGPDGQVSPISIVRPPDEPAPPGPVIDHRRPA